jgi:hypothetical protein
MWFCYYSIIHFHVAFQAIWSVLNDSFAKFKADCHQKCRINNGLFQAIAQSDKKKLNTVKKFLINKNYLMNSSFIYNVENIKLSSVFLFYFLNDCLEKNQK